MPKRSLSKSIFLLSKTKVKMFAIKYYSNIENNYVITDWYKTESIAWIKYEESEESDWFLFKDLDSCNENIFRSNPILVSSLFPGDFKYYSNPFPKRTMINMRECMVCRRQIEKQNSWDSEIEVKEVCWDTHPFPIFTFCRHNKKCKEIIYNKLKSC